MSDEDWILWKEKGLQYRSREELKNYKFNNMLDKLKSYVPLIILVLLVLIIGYWAIMLSLRVETLTGQNIENRQAITQIAQFIQSNKK